MFVGRGSGLFRGTIPTRTYVAGLSARKIGSLDIYVRMHVRVSIQDNPRTVGTNIIIPYF